MTYLCRKYYFNLFTGGESLQETLTNCQYLTNKNVSLCIDQSIEDALTESEWSYNCNTKLDLIKDMSSNSLSSNISFLPIKITGFVSPDLLEKMTLLIRYNNNYDCREFMNSNELNELESCINRLSTESFFFFFFGFFF